MLLDTLLKYGIRGIAHVWITTYLYDRRQYITFDMLGSHNEKVILEYHKDQF